MCESFTRLITHGTKPLRKQRVQNTFSIGAHTSCYEKDGGIRIYLAGKMDLEYGSWRTDLVGTWRHGVLWEGGPIVSPSWVTYRRHTDSGWEDIDDSVEPWTVGSRLVLGLYDYVGPYRREIIEESKHDGEFHGSTARGQHGVVDSDVMAVIVSRCKDAIRAADLVFAYLNYPDAYGTFAEIGYAAALGKFVGVLTKEGSEFEGGDFAFIDRLADFTAYLYSGSYLGFGSTTSKHVPDEREAVRSALKEAVLAFTARPNVSEPGPQSGLDVVHSFNQIAQWTSDPRVRNEAEAMLRKLARR